MGEKGKEMTIDTRIMTPCDQLQDPDPIESDALRRSCDEVRKYLKNYVWCKRIKGMWFAGGFSKISVFFVELESVNYDDKLWVIVGDLPPAHLVIDDIPDFKEALLVYASHMRDWISAVRLRKSIRDCIPVDVAPTKEHAHLLERRIDFIEKEYIPGLQGDEGNP